MLKKIAFSIIYLLFPLACLLIPFVITSVFYASGKVNLSGWHILFIYITTLAGVILFVKFKPCSIWCVLAGFVLSVIPAYIAHINVPLGPPYIPNMVLAVGVRCYAAPFFILTIVATVLKDNRINKG